MAEVVQNTTSAAVTPANLNETVVFTAGQGGALFVAAHLVNISAGSVDATLRWYDGTTNYALRNAITLAAKGFQDVDLKNLKIPSGGAIKVTSSVASALTATVTVVELPR